MTLSRNHWLLGLVSASCLVLGLSLGACSDEDADGFLGTDVVIPRDFAQPPPQYGAEDATGDAPSQPHGPDAVTSDTASAEPDVSLVEEVTEGEDVTPPEEDTGGGEEPLPDHLPETCRGNPQCPAALQGTPDTAINKVDGAPRLLGGGAKPAANYQLDRVDVYLAHCIGGMAGLAQVQSRGNTYGTALFCLDTWGLRANLDLQMSALGQSFPVAQQVFGGGDFQVAANLVRGDITECAGGGGSAFPIPETFAFENLGHQMTLEVRIPKAAVQQLLDQAASGMITAQDDLVLHLVFNHTGTLG